MNKLFINKKKLINISILCWATTIFLSTASKSSLDFDLSILIYPLLFFPYVFILGKKINNNASNSLTSIFLILLVFLGLISSAFHSDIAMIYSVFALVIFIFGGLYIYPALLTKNDQIIFFNSIFISSFIYFAYYSFIIGLNVRTSLQYGNTNTLGVATATAAVLGLGILFYYLEYANKLKLKLFLSAAILFFVYLTLLSASRTAFISIILVFNVLLCVAFLRAKINYKIKMAVLTVALYGLFILLFGDLLFETIINKFERKSSDVFDNRTILWGYIASNTGMLGLGMDFFRYDSFISAHSTYFSFMGRYGWLFFIVLFFYLAFSFIRIFYGLIFSKSDSINYILLACFSGFIFMSIAEIMIFKSIMVYALIFLGGYRIENDF